MGRSTGCSTDCSSGCSMGCSLGCSTRDARILSIIFSGIFSGEAEAYPGTTSVFWRKHRSVFCCKKSAEDTGSSIRSSSITLPHKLLQCHPITADNRLHRNLRLHLHHLTSTNGLKSTSCCKVLSTQIDSKAEMMLWYMYLAK